MASRLDLQSKLEELLESRNVYYQPPESLKMSIPRIQYSKTDIETRFANNSRYSNFTRYQIIVVDRKPDNPVIQKILDLPLTSFDRHYVSDNLNCDVINIYY